LQTASEPGVILELNLFAKEKQEVVKGLAPGLCANEAMSMCGGHDITDNAQHEPLP
jgi:hypothetical protein